MRLLFTHVLSPRRFICYIYFIKIEISSDYFIPDMIRSDSEVVEKRDVGLFVEVCCFFCFWVPVVICAKTKCKSKSIHTYTGWEKETRYNFKRCLWREIERREREREREKIREACSRGAHLREESLPRPCVLRFSLLGYPRSPLFITVFSPFESLATLFSYEGRGEGLHPGHFMFPRELTQRLFAYLSECSVLKVPLQSFACDEFLCIPEDSFCVYLRTQILIPCITALPVQAIFHIFYCLSFPIVS